MSRKVELPPSGPRLPDGARVGGWWHDDEKEAGRIVCDLCPRECALRPGDRGFCFVRENREGQMVLGTYGHSTGFCIDPVEKKPLNQYYPGSSILSFGTAGCNLGCKFCQNWSISKSREVESLSESASPEAIAQAALQLGCKSVAFTYNDPVIWAEYAIDTAKACRAVGVKSVAVTAGYITPQAFGPFYEAMDAANVDLKGFTEDFYKHVTSSHLQPVLDCLKRLKRETNVWFEITNLIIPQANDDRGDLARMCDWIYDELGPDVPVHFTAFHPDFKMRDRPHTPAETLFAAYDIAVSRGLRYVYVGNVADVARQTTYCPGCKKPVIVRAAYDLHQYAIRDGLCTHCRTPIAGYYENRPGTWGGRRQPVRISEFEQAQAGRRLANVELGREYGIRHPEATPPNIVTLSVPTPAKVPMNTHVASAPELTSEQRTAILNAAAEVLAAVVLERRPNVVDATLAGAAKIPLFGCFVTAKRESHLRGCIGFMGTNSPLDQALAHAAQRTAKDDHRFPPISPTELEHLHLDVWLLFNPQPVAARGEARRDAVVIGRHGLQIARGGQRGLLLPGVAVENNLDAEQFLQHVCRKAGLPPHSWQDDDVELATFEGIAIEGPLPREVLAGMHAAKNPFTAKDAAVLAEHCRSNILAFLSGGTPNPYAFGAADGETRGLLVTVGGKGQTWLNMTRYALREGVPVQSTLYQLSEQVAKVLSQGLPVAMEELGKLQVTLALLDDVAIHGTVEKHDLRGHDVKSRATIVIERNKSGFVFDPSLDAETAILDAVDYCGVMVPETAAVYSARVTANVPLLKMGQKPQAVIGEKVRPAAMAGKFYPGNPTELGKLVDQLLAGPHVEKQRVSAVMVPHAGLMYSGRLAADVLRRIEIPETVIILGPKHTPHGVEWAVAPQETWRIPGATLAGDPALARELTAAIPGLELDAAAHMQEHSIEVELPILAKLAPQSKVIGIAMGAGNYETCRRFAAGLAKVLADRWDKTLLVISSDMNHFASDAENRRLDELALLHIDRLDAAGLLSTCQERQISMCGVLPAVTVMETLRAAGKLHAAQRIGYATSADVSGDKSRVVGYAGVIFE